MFNSRLLRLMVLGVNGLNGLDVPLTIQASSWSLIVTVVHVENVFATTQHLPTGVQPARVLTSK
jgi:hypothetical protein